ncbi:MAG: hypothetical protein ACXWXH_11085 [Aeromicrobium sp.]
MQIAKAVQHREKFGEEQPIGDRPSIRDVVRLEQTLHPDQWIGPVQRFLLWQMAVDAFEELPRCDDKIAPLRWLQAQRRWKGRHDSG